MSSLAVLSICALSVEGQHLRVLLEERATYVHPPSSFPLASELVVSQVFRFVPYRKHLLPGPITFHGPAAAPGTPGNPLTTYVTK